VEVKNTDPDPEPKTAKIVAVFMGSAGRNLETQISGPRIYEVEIMDCDI
jgi:hypothetical protein